MPVRAEATSAVQSERLSIDGRRQAVWLKSAYSASLWEVADTHDATRTAKINFDFLLADGRSLIEVDGLLSTVKEYAWWLRDARFSRIDDSATHANMVRNLMSISHSLTFKGIWSFAHVQPYDLEILIEECQYGLDAVLHASERLQKHLEVLEVNNRNLKLPYGGLPRYIIESSGARTTVIHVEQLLTACNIPLSASTNPRVATVVSNAAQENGLKTHSRKAAKSEVPPFTNITVQALQRWLDPIEQLYSMRRRVEADAIEFRPFPRGAARVAAVKGVGTQRTPTAPPRLVLHLLEHAARWIFDHDRVRLSGPSTRAEALRMATACWILLAAFSARRNEEIDDLRSGCLQAHDEENYWLHIYIEKTLQHKEWIPVPLLVARAVETLETMSARARRQSKTDYLFQWLSPDGKIIRYDIGDHLDDFARLVKVPLHQPLDESPREWHWSPHQFRRFFAVLYFYRYEGASVEALAHHLRHFSLDMTRHYITQDPEVAALWTDVQWGYVGHVARTIVSGERSVGGTVGSRLKKTAQRLTDMFRRKLQIASVDRVAAALTLMMERQGLVLTPKPWITCTCPRTRDAAHAAACRSQQALTKDDVGPDFAKAGPPVCARCRFGMAEGDRLDMIDGEERHLLAAVSSDLRGNALIGRFERERLIDLRHVRGSLYEKAAPFTPRSSEVG